MTYSKAFQETFDDPLHEFQIENCIGCKFADHKAIEKRKPCCTYPSQLEHRNGKCLSRKENNA